MYNKSSKDVYQSVTDTIIEQLESGTVPWRKTWRAGNGDAPRNLFSKREYSGINIFLLLVKNFNSPYFATFNQIREHGGSVIKGSKGTQIIFWKFLSRCDKCGKTLNNQDKCPVCRRTREQINEDGELDVTPILRCYTVFNYVQTTGLEKYLPQESTENVPAKIYVAEEIIDNMPNKPSIVYGHGYASYNPVDDVVKVPSIDQFDMPAEYYSTLFHELGHSTAHKSRLNRPLKPIFMSKESYSREELVAEITATFLCADCHIERDIIDNAAAYIAGWLKALKNDKKMIIFAAAQAAKAAKYIKGEKTSNDDINENKAA